MKKAAPRSNWLWRTAKSSTTNARCKRSARGSANVAACYGRRVKRTIMVKHVLLGWQISTLHGWGIYGLNLALNWASDRQIESATTVFDPDLIVDIDPIQHRALAPFVRRSQEFQKVLQSHANGRIKFDGAFVAALGND